MSILISIIIFGALIFVHELGHFTVAKINDVRVDEFALGMGPKIAGIKKGETLYSLRAFPLGGFVRMAGMEPGEEEDDDPRGFNKKTVLQRAAVIFAGPFMNFVMALFLFIMVFMVMGVPSNVNVIGQVIPDNPAAQAGLRDGDRIVAIEGKEVNTWMELVTTIHTHPGKEIRVTFVRDQKEQTVSMVTEIDPQSGQGRIGIMQSWEKKGFFASIALGMRQAYEFTKLLIVALGQMITGMVAPEVAGPVGVVQMVGEVARFGIASLLTFAGILSINLGVINLFPIPALDGSHLVFLGLEGLRGRPIDPAKQNMIHLVGFALLMILMVVITYQDILRLFAN